jgi:hypothetical protein
MPPTCPLLAIVSSSLSWYAFPIADGETDKHSLSHPMSLVAAPAIEEAREIVL